MILQIIWQGKRAQLPPQMQVFWQTRAVGFLCALIGQCHDRSVCLNRCRAARDIPKNESISVG